MADKSDEDDFNVNDFNAGSQFLKKEDLIESGPQRKRIASVEQQAGFRKDVKGKLLPELVLVFSDGVKWPLRARTNRDDMATAFGERTKGWIGQVIEVYVDPAVRNPAGAKVGGLRMRVPMADGGPVDFVSDLEMEQDAEKDDGETRRMRDRA